MNQHDHDQGTVAARSIRYPSQNASPGNGRQTMSGSVSARMAMLAGVSFVTVTLIYMLREHWGHTMGVLPYLLLLACPLLHLFHGHGGHRRSHGDQGRHEP